MQGHISCFIIRGGFDWILVFYLDLMFTIKFGTCVGGHHNGSTLYGSLSDATCSWLVILAQKPISSKQPSQHTPHCKNGYSLRSIPPLLVLWLPMVLFLQSRPQTVYSSSFPVSWLPRSSIHLASNPFPFFTPRSYATVPYSVLTAPCIHMSIHDTTITTWRSPPPSSCITN